MKSGSWITAVLSFIAGITQVGGVVACSVSHVKTASEITAGANVILLVKVPDVEVKDESDIKMKVLEVIKGDFKEATITIRGQTANYDGPNDRPVPYDFVREGGRHGDCYASDYKRNGKFLLFLREGTVHWAALAATNEEVSGPEDPWVVWVKNQLAIQPKNKDAEH